jgi:hypothetical protein
MRVFVLEVHSPPPDVEKLLFMVAWFLAPISFFVSIGIFLILALMQKISLSEQLSDFLCSIIGWSLAGLGIASVIVIAVSAYYNSSQGPFSIVFLDGPLGVGVGTVVGFFMWLSKNGKNIGWQMAILRQR